MRLARTLGLCVALIWSSRLLVPAQPVLHATPKLGQEVAIARHLEDDEEFAVPLPDLFAFGKKLFAANWTEQEGGGRPLTKGTGKSLSDPTQPLTGSRSFNRFSAPDANSCAGCHNMPYGIIGGRGDFVANVFVAGQRFDFATFDSNDKVPTRGGVDEAGRAVTLDTLGNSRVTTGLFGAGYIELLAREITDDLQRIRDALKPGESRPLISKGVSFGRLSRTKDGLWITTEVEGLSRLSLISSDPVTRPTLVIRPWHQASNVVSLREFTNTAFNQHHGIQSTERFGRDTDPDGDGFVNELTRADVTAVTLFQAGIQVPGRVISRDPEIEQSVMRGEAAFMQIKCSRCHVPSLPLESSTFSEPGPFNPLTNVRKGEVRAINVDLAADFLPSPRLRPRNGSSVIDVPLFTDFKLHDISSGPSDPNAEPLDMNWFAWSPNFSAGNERFLTKRLWEVGSGPPYYHHGKMTTMRQAILAHSGEAEKERKAFEALPKQDRDGIIEYLKTLQVLPPGTKERVVNEYYRPRDWPPAPLVTPNEALP